MVKYLKKIALRGAGIIEPVHQTPFKYDPFAFSEKELPQIPTESNNVGQDAFLSDPSTSISKESSDIRSITIEKPPQERKDQPEQIITYEIPSFTGDRQTHEKSAQEDISHDINQHEEELNDINKEEINLSHPEQIVTYEVPSFSEEKYMIEKSKHEDIPPAKGIHEGKQDSVKKEDLSPLHPVHVDSIPSPLESEIKKRGDKQKDLKAEMEIIKTSSQEQINRPEQIVTYKIPTFPEEKFIFKKSAQQNSSRDKKRHKMKPDISNNEEKDRKTEPEIVDKALDNIQRMKEKSGKVKQVKQEKTSSPKLQEKIEKSVSRSMQHEIVSKMSDESSSRKLKTGTSSLASAKFDTEPEIKHTDIRTKTREIVRSDHRFEARNKGEELTSEPKIFNRYSGLEKKKEGPRAIQKYSALPITMVPKPKPKEVVSDFPNIPPEPPGHLPTIKSVPKAEAKPRTAEVKVSVGKLEVHIEGSRKEIGVPQKSREGFERYWLQRNYFRMVQQ